MKAGATDGSAILSAFARLVQHNRLTMIDQEWIQLVNSKVKLGAQMVNNFVAHTRAMCAWLFIIAIVVFVGCQAASWLALAFFGLSLQVTGARMRAYQGLCVCQLVQLLATVCAFLFYRRYSASATDAKESESHKQSTRLSLAVVAVFCVIPIAPSVYLLDTSVEASLVVYLVGQAVTLVSAGLTGVFIPRGWTEDATPYRDAIPTLSATVQMVDANANGNP